MSGPLRRIGTDIRHGRHIDAYVVSALAVAFAILTIAGDGVPDQLRWAALLAGVGLLVYRITVPTSSPGDLDMWLNDRTAFDGRDLSERFRAARNVWIFAPSAVNVLSAHHCEALRRGPLEREDGKVHVVVLDADDENAMRLATRQLDDALDYPLQDFRSDLATTLRRLETMARWDIKGTVSWRMLDYNPGFSLVAIDPTGPRGTLIVEFHGFHNTSTSCRMHIKLTRHASEYWYYYWTDQFERIWQRSARSRLTRAVEAAADPVSAAG